MPTAKPRVKLTWPERHRKEIERKLVERAAEVSEQRAAEVAKKNREFEAREERVADAQRYVQTVPKEQRMRSAIERLAAGIAQQRGMSSDQARQLITDAVRRGENKRGGR